MNIQLIMTIQMQSLMTMINNDEAIADTSSNETSDASTHTVTYKMCEYICITCHNILKRKKPKNAITSMCKWAIIIKNTTCSVKFD